MKKRLVLLLMTVAMIMSGCQNKENKSEIVVSSTTEHSVEEKSENPSNESVQTEEKSKEDAETVEEVTDAEVTENVTDVENTKDVTGAEVTEDVTDVENTKDVTDVKNEEASDNGKENVYKEQMDLVYQALSQKWSIDKYFENQISSLISNHYEGNALDNVGYALKDLDGDGKEELLISAVSKDSSGGMLYDVYSAPNGTVVHVLSGHERNRYYLQWLEEGAYMIANEASNSAFNSAWYYYSLIDGQLELMQGIIFNAEANENNPWFMTYDEDWDVSNDTPDTDGMAEAIIEAYARSYTTLEYIPFSAYNN